MKLFDLRHPWFNPLGRRIAVTAVCLFWGILELANANIFWAMMFLALAGLCIWTFFFDWTDLPPKDD